MTIQRKMIDELTGLRGIAALFIIFNHILLVCPVLGTTSLSSYLSCFGIMGMDLFFILSGFVIYYNYADKIKENPQEGIIKFLIARFARLYPLYITFISGFFIYNLFLYRNQYDVLSANITSLPVFITGMQSWVYGFINNMPVVSLQGNANISWSISTEFALYLFFIPLVLWGFKSKKVSTVIGFFVLTIIVQCLWIYFSFTNHSLSNLLIRIFGNHEGYKPEAWLAFYSPLGRIFQFLSGCFIAQFYMYAKSNLNLKSLYKIIMWLTLTVIVLCIYSSINLQPMTKHIVFSLLTSIFVFAVSCGEWAFLRLNALKFLGEVSYSSYLLHIIFVMIFVYRGNHVISYVLNTIPFIVCTYVLAWLSYKYFEMPARKKVKDFLYAGFNLNNTQIIKEEKYEKTSC